MSDVIEIFNRVHTFTIENKECAFKQITWGDALKAQNAIHLIATNEPKNIDEGNNRLLTLALKYVSIGENNEIQKPSLEVFSTQFENPFACVELGAQFRDYVLGFLEKLPSFQKLNNPEL